MGRLFGTDGIRGVANKKPMTSGTAVKVGQALTHVLKKREGHRPRIVVGKDTRLSGYMLESALAAGICAMGGDVVLVGPMPTPGIAFITSNMNADAGIVISASHNPYRDNGIKIFSAGGMKLNDSQEAEIEKLAFSSTLHTLLPDASEIGRAYRGDDALGRYIVFLKHTFPEDISLEGMKIVLDCANGATYKVAPTLFREMRAETLTINTEPDGININKDGGSLYPRRLAEKVISEKADIGLAFDGDGDRLIAVAENGQIITGDRIIAICAKHYKEERMLPNDTVVTTVMSNIGLSKALKKMKIRRITAPVGDRFVMEEMLREGAILGGEDSGHIIFLNHHTAGDGILTALQLLSVMKKTGQKLSTLASVMKVYPQLLKNLKLKEKKDLKSFPEFQKVLAAVEKQLGDSGRVLVRYSGTQPLLRIMAEGPTEEKTKKAVNKIYREAERILK